MAYFGVLGEGGLQDHHLAQDITWAISPSFMSVQRGSNEKSTSNLDLFPCAAFAP